MMMARVLMKMTIIDDFGKWFLQGCGECLSLDQQNVNHWVELTLTVQGPNLWNQRSPQHLDPPPTPAPTLRMLVPVLDSTSHSG
jgi:hypothetical protein